MREQSFIPMNLAARVRRECGASAARVRRECGASAARVRRECGANAARMLSGLALVLGLVWANSAQAQFKQASTAESFLGANANSAQNTGCGQSGSGINILQVMTWDGDEPSFGWNFKGSQTGHQPLEATNQGYNVTDPDIITFFDQNRDTYSMVAVYLASNGGPNTVRYEQQDYDPNSNSWNVVTPPTQISGNGDCASPNIAVDLISGNAVMVFQEGSSVYAQALDVPSASLYPISEVATNGPRFSYSQPDVAVYEDPNGGQPIIVSVTFITRSNFPSSLSVGLTQNDIASVQAGGPVFPTPAVIYGSFPASSVLETPRIAAPLLSVSSDDCMTVVHHNDGSSDRIVAIPYGSSNPSSSPQTVNSLTVSKPHNTRPVVTYLGDGALVAWQFPANIGVDIVATWVSLTGQPVVNGSSPGTLLVANQQTSGNQQIPSLASNNANTRLLAIWQDEDMGDIAYKTAGWFSAQLRPANPVSTPNTYLAVEAEKQLSVYPNPATASSHVALKLEANEVVQSLQVLEVRTGKIVADLTQAELRGEFGPTLPNLPEGMYVLRLQTNKTSRVARFSYQP